jgi:hypothetical protein
MIKYLISLSEVSDTIDTSKSEALRALDMLEHYPRNFISHTTQHILIEERAQTSSNVVIPQPDHIISPSNDPQQLLEQQSQNIVPPQNQQPSQNIDPSQPSSHNPSPSNNPLPSSQPTSHNPSLSNAPLQPPPPPVPPLSPSNNPSQPSPTPMILYMNLLDGTCLTISATHT